MQLDTVAGMPPPISMSQ